MAQALVDLDAIAHNVRLLRRAATNADLMAVVKANAYGHGCVEVARTALSHGASWLAVAAPAEAITLRNADVEAKILLMLYASDDGIADALDAHVDVTASSVGALRAIALNAARLGYVARVHLEADTGMSRGGASPADWPSLVTTARDLQLRGLVRIVGAWSHLAVAEEDGDGLQEQLRKFARFRRILFSVGLRPSVTHLANSTATLRLPRSRFDLVRPGLAVYGVEPVPSQVFGLRPAMTVQAPVIDTQRVPAGTGVSYGWSHVTDRETTLAQVPLGFADGVPRCASGQASVLIRGRRMPIVGQVTMDRVVVDVGDVPVRAGDLAVMFGPGTGGEPTVTEWAEWAHTVPSDVLTGIRSRVQRRYLPVRCMERR